MQNANVLFRTDQNKNYDDGDIIHIWNHKDIQFCHAHNICFQRNGTRKLDEIVAAHGTLPMGGMVHAYESATVSKRFRQDGRDLYIKDMVTGEEFGPFSGTGGKFTDPFTGKQVHIDLKRYLRDRKVTLNDAEAHGKPIFGPPGKHFYYGGRTDTTHAAMTRVWDNIERLSGKLRTDEAYRYYPGIGTSDLGPHGFAEVDNIRDDEKRALTEPLYDPATVGPGGRALVDEAGEPVKDQDGNDIEPIVIKERRHRFRYADAATPENLLRLRDRRDQYDGRAERLVRREETHDTIRRKRMGDTEVKLADDSKTFSKTER